MSAQKTLLSHPFNLPLTKAADVPNKQVSILIQYISGTNPTRRTSNFSPNWSRLNGFRIPELNIQLKVLTERRPKSSIIPSTLQRITLPHSVFTPILLHRLPLTQQIYVEHYNCSVEDAVDSFLCRQRSDTIVGNAVYFPSLTSCVMLMLFCSSCLCAKILIFG